MAPDRRIYLDFNASAPLVPQAREAMCAAMELAGNPSSVHAEGRRQRGIIEQARDDVAALVNAEPSEVVFTSGASEANTWVLANGWHRVVMWPGLEHDSVVGALKAHADQLALDMPVRTDGTADLDALERSCTVSATGHSLATLQLANNETGVMQPVARLAAFGREHGLAVHTDAVQAAGRSIIDFKALDVDALTLSAHKMGGPKGVGALVIRDGFELAPLIAGGGQERRRRAGTENVAAIAGFGAAARVARERLADMERVRTLRDRLELALLEITPDARVAGAGSDRLPNTTCIMVPGHAAEITVIKLDVAGFAVSAGAACSSGKVAPSRVLAAMGLGEELARCGVRISIGAETTLAGIDAFVAAWRDINSNTNRQQAKTVPVLRRVG